MGDSNGWTKLFNTEYKLIIGGGVVNGIEYLDSIQYGNKLSNQYNNYVNPFFMLDVLTKEGRLFFLNYYKSDIESLVHKREIKIAGIKDQLKDEMKLLSGIKDEVYNLWNG